MPLWINSVVGYRSAWQGEPSSSDLRDTHAANTIRHPPSSSGNVLGRVTPHPLLWEIVHPISESLGACVLARGPSMGIGLRPQRGDFRLCRPPLAGLPRGSMGAGARPGTGLMCLV
jgi:hypothetical protein